MNISKSLKDIISELEELKTDILQVHSTYSTTGSEVTDSSGENEEKPLSHAEESAIDECLNDTEGSLSNVDLNIFNTFSDHLPVHKVKKSRDKRTSERFNMDFVQASTDCDSSSLDEFTYHRHIALSKLSLSENSTGPMIVDTEALLSSIEQSAKKISLRNNFVRDFRNHLNMKKSMNSPNLLSNVKRIVRRKRRNSPPVKKSDKTHIYSFFTAMADLVSTFPNNQVITAKYNVTTILHEIVLKAKNLYTDKDPKNISHGHTMIPSDFRLIDFKLSRSPFVH